MTGTTEGAQSIARAGLLLRALSTFGSTGSSLMDIAALTGLSKPTAHRMLSALVEQRLVERPPGTRLYRLGPDIFAFGIGIHPGLEMKRLARASLERMVTQEGVAAYLGVRCGFDMLCLDRAEGDADKLPLLLEVNARWPLGVGSFSLAMLAFLTEHEMAETIAFNRRRVDAEDTLTYKHIEASIRKTRRNGYAKRTMRSYGGIAGIAAPVFDARKYPIASLCVVAEAGRMNGAFLTALAQKLKREAALIGQLYEGPRLQQQDEHWRAAVRGSAPKVAPTRSRAAAR
jgi:DNA-binding IclR family transcriptional regulator